jgi:hypothetical protein
MLRACQGYNFHCHLGLLNIDLAVRRLENSKYVSKSFSQFTAIIFRNFCLTIMPKVILRTLHLAKIRVINSRNKN